MGRVPSKPRRRTYRTGGQLPALTTDFRPIPLGRDENGDPDGQVRALAVLLRNRSDSAVYVREGPDTDDEFEISPGEQYKIWEPNGVNSLSLKGASGGENVEVRTLEAHNDFDITDRIEAFARSIAHFVGTATANTTITGQDVDLSIDDAGGINITGSVDASGSTVDASGSNVTVDDIAAGTVTIGDITGQTTTLDITGDVDATGSSVDVSGNVTVDDILAGSVDIGNVTDTITIDDIQTGSVSLTGTSDVDIQAQSVGDISTRDIEGTPVTRFLSEDGKTGAYSSTFGSFISDIYRWEVLTDSQYDGFITSLWVRFYTTESTPDIAEHMAHMYARVEVDDGNGWEPVQPPETWSAEVIAKDAPDSREVNVERVGPDESVWRWEPANPLKFRAGDDVRIQVSTDSRYGSFTGSSDNETFDVEMALSYIERRGQ
jgi:hypothetical protein